MQAPEVIGGISESIRVIYAQSVHRALLHQPQYEPVRRLKDPFVLDPDAGQVIDGEETPVVDLIASHPPVRKPVRLRLKETMQSLEPRVS